MSSFSSILLLCVMFSFCLLADSYRLSCTSQRVAARCSATIGTSVSSPSALACSQHSVWSTDSVRFLRRAAAAAVVAAVATGPSGLVPISAVVAVETGPVAVTTVEDSAEEPAAQEAARYELLCWLFVCCFRLSAVTVCLECRGSWRSSAS